MLRALKTAASVDAEAREVWDRFQRQARRPRGGRRRAAPQDGRVRYDDDTITDTLWMLTPDAYLRLVRDAGWPVERFQAWLTDVLLRLILD